MKQLVYLLFMLGLGSVGALFYGAFWSIFVYYHFTVLRPPYLWRWSLPPGIEWSMYASMPPILFSFFAIGELNKPGRGFSKIHWAMLAFFFWLTISVVMARNQQVAYEWYVVNFKIFLMAGVASLLIATLRQVWWMYLMVAASLGYIGYEMNFEYFVNGYMKIRNNGFAEYDNNTAGLMLAMGIPMCWFAWEAISRWWRWIFAAFVPILLHAVLMSFSRGAMVSLVIAMPLIVLRSRFRLATAVGMGVFLLFGLPLFAGKEIQERFLSIEKSDADESANSRIGTWTAAYKMAVANPVFGVGVRNSPMLVGEFGHANRNQTIHSQYLQVAADTGFVGLGLYLSMVGLAVAATTRSRSTCEVLPTEIGIETKSMLSGLECSLITFLVGAVFLSLETFEVTYIVLVMIARLTTLLNAVKK